MVHRVYSKSSDIKKLTIKQLQKIEYFLNNLPRKALGYKTSNEGVGIKYKSGLINPGIYPFDKFLLIMGVDTIRSSLRTVEKVSLYPYPC